MVSSKLIINKNSIAIVGWDDGGAGQVQAWIESSLGYHVACFLHTSNLPPSVDIKSERKKRDARLFDFPMQDSFKGRPLISSLNWCDTLSELGLKKALIMTVDQRRRLEDIDKAKESGIELISAIHPSALILDEAKIHENVVVFPKAVIGYRAEIFRGAFINTGAQIDHHGVIRECAAINPGVITAGNVTVERFATVHTGAVIKNRIRIGEDSIVGAGAVIIRDVPPKVTVVGVPGRIIKDENVEK